MMELTADKKAAKKWWNGLSINEEKQATKIVYKGAAWPDYLAVTRSDALMLEVWEAFKRPANWLPDLEAEK